MANRRDVVASAADVASHFRAGQFDAVICNSVLGWSLNTAEAAGRAVDGFWQILRPGGVLIIGWNDRPPHNRLPPSRIEALRRFEPYDFPNLGPKLLADVSNQHIYEFYQRRN